METDAATVEIHAIENGLTVGIYRGSPRRAASFPLALTRVK